MMINFYIIIFIKQLVLGVIPLLPHCRTALPPATSGPQGLFFIDTLRSPSDTPHPVGLLWTGGQTDADAST